MGEVTVEWLKSIEAFNLVPELQLQWMMDNSEIKTFAEGEILFEQGTPVNAMFIVCEGKVSMYVLQNNEAREVIVVEPKGINGYLPFSRGKINFSSGRALVNTQILSFPVEMITEMICYHFELTQALVHVMSNRVRDFTAQQRQDEKMLALGRLSGSLAHELNNPASALIRDAGALKNHLYTVRKTFREIAGIKLRLEKIDLINSMLTHLLSERQKPVLTLLERTVREDELANWLDHRHIDNAFEIAESFVEFGLTIGETEIILQQIPEPYISFVLKWMNDNILAERMLTDMAEASKRIADLVNSIKAFTHMDQGWDKQYADIHIGIRNTLDMLRPMIQQGRVEVIENFELSLPPVNAMIGELNQVWTQLIDNALDAMEDQGSGVLELKTSRLNESVYVAIIDNGPGVPEEIQSKIFDPFFTTKPIGKGIGLGLEVVSAIIAQHRGTIRFNSIPGRTEFVVCFPISG
jgi:signal transduction histidine kinase